MLQDKIGRLKEYLKDLGSVAIAFSGGVDSTFLLKVAHEALGDNAVAITAQLASIPEYEIRDAVDFAVKEGIRHIVCDIDEFEIEGFQENPKNRCYICKKAIFGKMIETAAENGINNVTEGSNTDDTGDYRPGMKAVSELDVKSPLLDCGWSKREIRDMSKQMGLSTWNKPSMACLASRFAYGETITKEKLKAVEETEKLLFDKGFSQVRVRVHGNLARIETTENEFSKLFDEVLREEIYSALKERGFQYVSVDLRGYRTGSMNESLSL